jgi:hypothetical protein
MKNKALLCLLRAGKARQKKSRPTELGGKEVDSVSGVDPFDYRSRETIPNCLARSKLHRFLVTAFWLLHKNTIRDRVQYI